MQKGSYSHTEKHRWAFLLRLLKNHASFLFNQAINLFQNINGMISIWDE